MESAVLKNAEIVRFIDGCKEFAFTITGTRKHDADDIDAPDSQQEVIVLACDTREEYEKWLGKLQTVAWNMRTVQLGSSFVEFRKFVLNVTNRRTKIDTKASNDFSPAFKAKLWKLRAGGDRLKADDWWERDMWIAKNGSLVYYSEKEGRDLVYYNSEDLKSAALTTIPSHLSCKPFAFSVWIPASHDVQFAPGDFAANTGELRTTWIAHMEAAIKQTRNSV
jgi:hypothetical protein